MNKLHKELAALRKRVRELEKQQTVTTTASTNTTVADVVKSIKAYETWEFGPSPLSNDVMEVAKMLMDTKQNMIEMFGIDTQEFEIVIYPKDK